ncbi:hypothetical protein EYR36_011334 [Pleurotus pulmonarius]|nr:hypothetical protein EYR36_011334 [Pleurotus pulmonarius]
MAPRRPPTSPSSSIAPNAPIVPNGIDDDDDTAPRRPLLSTPVPNCRRCPPTPPNVPHRQRPAPNVDARPPIAPNVAARPPSPPNVDAHPQRPPPSPIVNVRAPTALHHQRVPQHPRRHRAPPIVIAAHPRRHRRTHPIVIVAHPPSSSLTPLTHHHIPNTPRCHRAPLSCPIATTSTPNKPRSTRSATKALQEALNEDLPVQVKKVRKTNKTNKKIKTSADRDEEDEEAEEPAVQNMTATSRILSESGAALALPPRRAGTGVLLPPVAPRIVSTRVRRADPGDVPQVVDKGKSRDLTNLGSSDAEDEPEDEDDEEEGVETNYNTYSKIFDNADQFPILHALLNDPAYDQSSEEHRAVWGTRKLTKENLVAVTKELKDKEDKEKRAMEKARLAKEKKSKKASTSNFSLQALLMLLSFWLLLGLLPCVAAAPLEDPFPGILFVDFAKVITSNFGADITLATVLMLLFSVTNNTDLLNLHGQQQAVPTNTQVVTSWMAAFVRAIKDRLQLDSLVADDDSDAEMNSDSGSGSGSDSGSGSNTSGSSDGRSTC